MPAPTAVPTSSGSLIGASITRSGKSALAERRAEASGLEVIYVATAQVGDAEMAERVRLHKQNRPENWGLVEEPLYLAAALRAHSRANRLLLVDCLTLWLSKLLGDDPVITESLFADERKSLLETLPLLPGSVILVSNETGLGIVPMGRLTRRFVDEAGWLHQGLAELSDRVLLTVAGLPIVLKGTAI